MVSFLTLWVLRSLGQTGYITSNGSWQRVNDIFIFFLTRLQCQGASGRFLSGIAHHKSWPQNMCYTHSWPHHLIVSKQAFRISPISSGKAYKCLIFPPFALLIIDIVSLTVLTNKRRQRRSQCFNAKCVAGLLNGTVSWSNTCVLILEKWSAAVESVERVSTLMATWKCISSNILQVCLRSSIPWVLVAKCYWCMDLSFWIQK